MSHLDQRIHTHTCKLDTFILYVNRHLSDQTSRNRVSTISPGYPGLMVDTLMVAWTISSELLGMYSNFSLFSFRFKRTLIYRICTCYPYVPIGKGVDISVTVCVFVCVYGYGFLRRGQS